MSSPKVPFWFIHPANILLVGPTRAGKTYYLEHALQNNQFDPTPQRIVWVYSEWQPSYERLQTSATAGLMGTVRKIEFVKDNIDYESIYDAMEPDMVNMLVLDDQMTEAKKNLDHLSNLFVKGSHHRNITVVLMLQNMFEKGMRTASLNTQYMVLFKNPRDLSQISKLAEQLAPHNRKFIIDSYMDATKEPHSHLVLDLQQETPEIMKLLACTNSKTLRVYTRADYDLEDENSL